MKTILLGIPEHVKRVNTFYLRKKYYLINDEKIPHNHEIDDYEMYNYHVIVKAVLVTLYKEENIL